MLTLAIRVGESLLAIGCYEVFLNEVSSGRITLDIHVLEQTAVRVIDTHGNVSVTTLEPGQSNLVQVGRFHSLRFGEMSLYVERVQAQKVWLKTAAPKSVRIKRPAQHGGRLEPVA